MSDESLDDIIADLDKSIAKTSAELAQVESDGVEQAEAEEGTPEAKGDRTKRVERAGEPAPATGGPRRRLVGLLAMLLGVLGCLLAVVSAFLMLRLLFGASGAVDRLMEPVDRGIERLEVRIDQTDDLIDSGTIDPGNVDELRARIDGLVDITNGVGQGLDRIESHPLYGVLPAGTGDLGSAVDDFVDGAAEIDDRLGRAADGDDVSPAVAATIGDRVDAMQAGVSDVRELADDAASSLATWTRLGSIVGFLASLWGLWAQVSLTRRGWRGFRGRPI